MRRTLTTGFRTAALAILALVMTTAGPATPIVSAQDADLEVELDRIARETAELRGLPPLAEIDDRLLSQEELLALMPVLIAEGTDPEALAADARSLAALGLIPEDLDLVDLSIRLLGEQAAGFYDPVTDEMIVLTDGDFGSEEYYYAHEVMHALQDAHLDPLDLMEETESDNGDEALALIALYEGDAVVTSTAYLENYPHIAFDLLRDAQAEFPVLDEAPGAIAVALVFPYFAGEAFVSRLYDEGGWAAVDAAYSDLPISTEQILHPQKYLERDWPVTVALPAPEAVLGDGWRSVDEDTLGELQIGLLLANLGPGEGINSITGAIALPEAARNAAAGWDGDRFALWEDASGQEVLVWRSAWDTPQDARAFSRALAQFGNERWSGLFNGESPDDIALVTDDIAARILLDGQQVFYAHSPDLALTDAALAALQAAPAPDPAPGPN